MSPLVDTLTAMGDGPLHVHTSRRRGDALAADADVKPLPPSLPQEPGSVSSLSAAPVGRGAR